MVSSQEEPLLTMQRKANEDNELIRTRTRDGAVWLRKASFIGLFCLFILGIVHFHNKYIGDLQFTIIPPKKGGHQHPTLLSVVDANTMEYLKVKDQYFVYDKWTQKKKKPQQHIRSFSDSVSPPMQPLHLDKTEIHRVQESLTLSWKEIKDEVQDDDVLVLYCGKDDDERIMDMATISQARATSNKHSFERKNAPQFRVAFADEEKQKDITECCWHIPSLPIALSREEQCRFVLYQNEHPFAESEIIQMFVGDSPTNIKIALGDDTTKIILQFTTGSEGNPVAMLYGSDNKPISKFEGTSDSYIVSDMCAGPANETGTGKFIDPGQLHTIEVTGLMPNTQYKYKVGLTFGQGVVWSDEFTFTSQPSVGNLTAPYTYLVYGDQGCPSVGWGQGGAWVSAMVAREQNARAVHHIGDLSYARGAAHIWDEWLTMISGFASRLPLMIAVGNNEYDHTIGGERKDPSGVNASHGFMPKWGNMRDDSGGECGVPIAKRFRMPASSPGSNGVFWYSFDSANIHTIVLSSEHDLSSKSLQHKWLESDLRSVDREKTPWLVVELHRPMYFNEALWGQLATGIGMRVEFEDLLAHYNVDLVLSGHLHSYFRSCPGLFHSRCHNGGPTHISVGTAGAVMNLAPTFSNSWSIKNIQGHLGYGRITVHNDTLMHFEFVKAGPNTDNTSGEVLDDVWITHSQDLY